MLLNLRFYIAVSGPLIEYWKTFKKFSLGAELQPLRASPAMGFTQAFRFLEAGQGGGWGCGSCRSTAAEARPRGRGGASLWWCLVAAGAAGSGFPVGDNRGQQSPSPPCRGSCRLLQGVKAKVPLPQIFLNHG